MKRAAPILLLAMFIGPLGINFLFTIPARADCGADLQTVRGQAPAIKDEQRRKELQKLIEKAEKDDKAGRGALCDQTVQRARVLLK